MLPSGWAAADTAPLEGLVALRTRAEMKALKQLSPENQAILQKQSTLCLVGPAGVVAKSPIFVLSIAAIVLLNTVSLALERDGVPAAERTFTDALDIVCIIVFTADIVFKIWALGFHNFWRARFNRFGTAPTPIPLPPPRLCLILDGPDWWCWRG